jgi:hypothetical protein
MDGHPDAEEIAQRVHSAIAARDWACVRALLHPYMHWVASDGTTIRGRTHVMTALQDTEATPIYPASIEIRDGQIYRWHT